MLDYLRESEKRQAINAEKLAFKGLIDLSKTALITPGGLVTYPLQYTSDWLKERWTTNKPRISLYKYFGEVSSSS